MNDSATHIADLPNFGPKSQQMLALAGIHMVEQLRELGALTGQHWQVVAKEARLRLLLELEDVENEHPSSGSGRAVL